MSSAAGLGDARRTCCSAHKLSGNNMSPVFPPFSPHTWLKSYLSYRSVTRSTVCQMGEGRGGYTSHRGNARDGVEQLLVTGGNNNPHISGHRPQVFLTNKPTNQPTNLMQLRHDPSLRQRKRRDGSRRPKVDRAQRLPLLLISTLQHQQNVPAAAGVSRCGNTV